MRALSGAVRQLRTGGFGLTALTALDNQSCQACQAAVRKLSGDSCQVVRPGLKIRPAASKVASEFEDAHADIDGKAGTSRLAAHAATTVDWLLR